MALVGLKRAAELTGKNQSTIHRAMKAHRLAFSVSDTEERLIDTAELHRVFPILTEVLHACEDAPELPRNDKQVAELQANLKDARAENASLRDRVSSLEADNSSLEADKAYLRKDMEDWKTQFNKQQLLLSDLTQKLPPPPLPPRKGWVAGVAVAVVVLCFGGAGWWVVHHLVVSALAASGGLPPVGVN